MFKLLIPIIVGLLIAVSAHAATTRTLRIGNQSVTLTSDKRSAPALAVQMPAGDIWYGTLTGGTAPGRLTVQMPPSGQWAGQIFSLIPPPNYTFSGIFADFPQVWTWDQEFRNVNPSWNGLTVFWLANQYNLTGAGIWPAYHVQATCSATAATYMAKGNPVLPTLPFGGTARHCWCRLKRRSDGANGGWVWLFLFESASVCAINCPNNCAWGANDTAFRAAMLAAFANP